MLTICQGPRRRAGQLPLHRQLAPPVLERPAAGRRALGSKRAACARGLRSIRQAADEAQAAGIGRCDPHSKIRRRPRWTEDPTRKPFYKSLYFQVITAIVIGVLLGHFYPQTGEAMKPLGDGFIKLIKMIIAPIIFCTVVVGIAGMEDMKKVGKTGGLALLYFEIVSSIALVVGLVIINIVQPGAGMNIDASTLDTKGIAAYTGPGQDGDARPSSCST